MEGYMEGKYVKITNNFSTLNNDLINNHITAFQHYSYIKLTYKSIITAL